MSGTKATIDGIPIINAGAVSWRLTTGTTPYETTVVVASKAVNGNLVGKQTTLDVRGAKDSFAATCWIINQMVGPHPQMTTLTLCDKRWLWPRKHYLRRMNVRRRTGDRRMLTEGVPERLALAVDDYYYEVATLRNGAVWTPQDALVDVLTYVDGAAPKMDGVTFRKVPIENIEIDDPGDSAIDRIRSLTAGINVCVDLNGGTFLIDETDIDSATRLLKTFGAPVVGKGLASVIDRSMIRPSVVDVLIHVECELKCTSVDEGNTYSLKGDTRKYIENVLPVPDVSLRVGGRTVPRGTYITVDEAFAAWGTPTIVKPGITAPPISHDIVQKLWIEGNLEDLYTSIGDNAPASDDWAARIRAVRQHYRTTYRISQYWMSRIRYLKDSRVAIIDRENGVRAPAYVTADYSYTPNTRGRLSDPSQAGWIINVTDAYSESLADSKPIPCTLEIIDGQLGIVHLNFQLDKHNIWQNVYPSAMGNLPKADYRAGQKAPVFTGGATYGSAANAPYLAADHHVAFVLTAAPSAPNNNGQLLRIRVKADDVKQFGVNVGAANGPGMEVRLGLGSSAASIARFMWQDKAESSIDRLFGSGVGTDTPTPDYGPAVALKNAGLLSDNDECEQVAKAVAASVYSALSDRVIGTQAMRLGTATLKPTGNMVEVEFSLGVDGAMNTTANFNPTRGRIDITSLLSSDVRRKLFGLAQQ